MHLPILNLLFLSHLLSVKQKFIKHVLHKIRTVKFYKYSAYSLTRMVTYLDSFGLIKNSIKQ